MEKITPDVLLRIVDRAPDMNKSLDAILYGRAESMRSHLMDMLSGCTDGALLQSLLDTLNALPQVFRTRILVSSELGEWMSNHHNQLAGKADAAGGGYEDLLHLFKREMLISRLLSGESFDESSFSMLPEKIWSPLGDWQAIRRDEGWWLVKPPMIGDVIAVDFDSPMACKFEPESGILSQQRLTLTDEEREQIVSKLNTALQTIDDCIPEYGALIRNVTRRIIIRKSVQRYGDDTLRGSPFGSEHVPRQPGSIRLLNIQLPEFTNANCMESLLHESTHNLLAAWETMNGRFVSRQQDYRPISPWSGNPIPNSSFIHAVFVYYVCHNLFHTYLHGLTDKHSRDANYVSKRLPVFGVGFLTNRRVVDMLALTKPLNHPELPAVLDEIQSKMREFYRTHGHATAVDNMEHAA